MDSQPPHPQQPATEAACKEVAALRRQVAELTEQLAAARQAEATLRTFCDSAPLRMGLVEVNGDEVVLLWGNEAFARFYGLAAGALPGLSGTQLGISPAYRAAWVKAYQRAVRSGQPVSAEIHDPDSGSWALATIAPVAGPADRPPRACFAVTDITPHKQAEQELRKSEARLAAAQRIAHVGSWEWQVGTEQVWWSDELYRIFGLVPGEFTPTLARFFEHVHPDDRDMIRAHIEATLSRGDPYVFEHRIVWPDGSVRTLWAEGHLERDHASLAVRLSGTSQDITDRKHAEEERLLLERKLQEAQKLESLGVLAGGIAHDFNNLLVAIMGNTSLVEIQLPPGAPGRSELAQVQLAAERAAQLCRQMLAYSGRGRFTVARLDLDALVRELVELLRLSISKKAELVCELAGSLPAVLADATQVRQVVMNLVLNASEALGDRPGLIRLRTGVRQEKERRLVWLEVADTGCGMDEATRARIFDPFFTTKFTGRGLGLAAVQGIVRSHQGRMEVESEPGHGSTFRLLLPAADGAAQEERQPSCGGQQSLGGGTVLVVDDEDWVRDVAERMLGSLGFHVVQARDGEEAITRFHEAPDVRLVLLDLTMPRLDGEETFRALHLLQPGLPVILMSGFSEQEAASRFVGRGLAGFLPKPFRLDDLADRVRAALHRKVPAQ